MEIKELKREFFEYDRCNTRCNLFNSLSFFLFSFLFDSKKMTFETSTFPIGYFYIISKLNGMALDIDMSKPVGVRAYKGS